MRLTLIIIVMCLPSVAMAGVYYSQETYNDLPASLRGLLLDLRTLRIVGMPAITSNAPPLRESYADAANRLENQSKQRQLTADEASDLGALYLRLGYPEKALVVLRTAQKTHPKHFRILANLGTAWQRLGDLRQAVFALDEAIELAPKASLEFEQYHRKLVRLRAKESGDYDECDNLFDVQYVGKSGSAEPGKIADAEREKLPKNALVILQQLCLWFPDDPRLLWQLAEICNALGDVRTAANILDGCITEFAMKSKNARQRRAIYRAEVDRLEKLEQHNEVTIPSRSSRALATLFDASRLPKVQPNGVNPLPWVALCETRIEKNFQVKHLEYVRALDGKTVSIAGFIRPGGDTAELQEFLLTEFAIGCWFCETPSPFQLIAVVTLKEKPTAYVRGIVIVTGQLQLNTNDPEKFLFNIVNATVRQAD